MNRRPPAGIFARQTRDTSNEYFRHRVRNTTDPEYLRAMARVEAERDKPRQERIALINDQLYTITD